ncbi:hypothetical protein [Massilia consociata]|uniref:DUF3606 domain-containing protein n=1 Tax=Massilia consociata TaxID=760117 RepID=A0ABV6FLR8_9BURK
MDALAENVINAIEAAGHMAPSWIADKRAEYGKAERAEVLRWVCLSLDPANIEHAARAIGVSVEDLKATGRVLRKT